MIKWILIPLVMFASFAAKAQAPGYMGRKVVAGYGFYINPAITAALIDYGTQVVNIQHELFLELSVKRGLALGTSFRMYNSTYNNTGIVSLQLGASPPGYFSSSREVGSDPSGQISIKARNYAFYAKFYKSHYVAPWGRYFLLGLTLNTRECTYDPDEMYVSYKLTTNSYPYTTQEFHYNNFGPVVQSFNYPDVMIGAGNSRIFWKKLVIDYGYNINAGALIFTVVDAFDLYAPSQDRYVQVNSGMRARGINRFNFFIKAGYLF